MIGTVKFFSPGYFIALAALGIVGLGIALNIGSVIVVSPLIATTPVFTLLLGYMVFRREVITWPNVAAIVLIIIGCVLIVFR